MSLFGSLHDDVFLVFSRERKTLYEAVLTAIYKSFFEISAQRVRRHEILDTIYSTLQDNPELWVEEVDEDLVILDMRHSAFRGARRRGGDLNEATQKATDRKTQVYQTLLRTGWLEEFRYGIDVRVDMPYGSLLLLERLIDIKRHDRVRIGGLIHRVKMQIEECLKNPQQAAHSLGDCKESCQAFIRGMRSILGSLSMVEKNIVNQATRNDKLKLLMEDFIGELLLQDFHEMYASKTHPYRYRADIINSIETLLHDDGNMLTLAHVYVGLGYGRNVEEARSRVVEDLHHVRSTFSAIERNLQDINAARLRIEHKLGNLVRYSHLRNTDFIKRALPLVEKLSRYVDPNKQILAPVRIATPNRVVGEGQLRAPAKPRKKSGPSYANAEEISPIDQYKIELKEAHAQRIRLPIEQIVSYVFEQLPESGTLEAKDLRIESVDDYLVFIEILNVMYAPTDQNKTTAAVRRRLLLKEFRVSTDGLSSFVVDNDWVRCDNFRITTSRPKPTYGADLVAPTEKVLS
ncbi:Wadjet anti-phage system protein JetA family protein [Thalassospira xiamenensis]|uniref:Uncharacterized protein n=1 Tax=Thalassospira xiamenensis TaxID=220697 RepID=A0A285TH41_9PROT|nr:Wadjet anti-phage system protein JetA family protein [Thalassospira xiamenensis]SOC21469.1 hypothetical protein SAMN05428964_103412 [Thalassospira xiamenensis]